MYKYQVLTMPKSNNKYFIKNNKYFHCGCNKPDYRVVSGKAIIGDMTILCLNCGKEHIIEQPDYSDVKLDIPKNKQYN